MTVTHTAGVVALGVVALGLSAWILPEQLYPWLNLVSGVLVVGVGVAVLRGRMRKRGHDHAPRPRPRTRPRAPPPPPHDRRSLLALGASAGLIPCPSALVVLLGAVAQHRIGLGLVLIVAFSAGLAATLTGLGLAVVHAGRVLARLPVPGRLVTAIPAASAALIVLVGDGADGAGPAPASRDRKRALIRSPRSREKGGEAAERGQRRISTQRHP